MTVDAPTSMMCALENLARPWLTVLADASLKGLAVLALAAAAATALRKTSAAARQLPWLLAMAALLALPVLSLALPGWQVLPEWMRLDRLGLTAPAPEGTLAEVPPPPLANADPIRAPDYVPDGAEHEIAPGPAAGPPVIVSAPPSADAPPPPPGAEASGPDVAGRILSWAMLLWLAGMLASLAPLAVGWIGLWRLKRTALPTRCPALQAMLQQAKARLGLNRPVRLLESPRPAMPMIWGILRPTLLLPAEAASWPAQRQWIVLLHELGHARRWDCLARLVGHLACAMYWFNPLAWVALRRLQSESERACDDLVLSCGSRPCDYAEHLLAIASRLQVNLLTAHSGIAMARPGTLEQRLRAILDEKRNRRRVTAIGLLVAALAAGGIVLPLSVMRAGESRNARAATAPALRDPSTGSGQDASPPTTQPGEGGEAERIRGLIEQLGASKFEERQAAQQALVRIGPGAIPALRAAAQDKDRERAARATQALESIQRYESIPDTVSQVLLKTYMLGNRAVDASGPLGPDEYLKDIATDPRIAELLEIGARGSSAERSRLKEAAIAALRKYVDELPDATGPDEPWRPSAYHAPGVFVCAYLLSYFDEQPVEMLDLLGQVVLRNQKALAVYFKGKLKGFSGSQERLLLALACCHYLDACAGDGALLRTLGAGRTKALEEYAAVKDTAAGKGHPAEAEQVAVLRATAGFALAGGNERVRQLHREWSAATQPATQPGEAGQAAGPLRLVLVRDDAAGGGARGPHFRLLAENRGKQAVSADVADVRLYCIDLAGNRYQRPVVTTRPWKPRLIEPAGEGLLCTFGCGGTAAGSYGGWGPPGGVGYTVWAVLDVGAAQPAVESNRVSVPGAATQPATQPAATEPAGAEPMLWPPKLEPERLAGLWLQRINEPSPGQAGHALMVLLANGQWADVEVWGDPAAPEKVRLARQGSLWEVGPYGQGPQSGYGLRRWVDATRKAGYEVGGLAQVEPERLVSVSHGSVFAKSEFRRCDRKTWDGLTKALAGIGAPRPEKFWPPMTGELPGRPDESLLVGTWVKPEPFRRGGPSAWVLLLNADRTWFLGTIYGEPASPAKIKVEGQGTGWSTRLDAFTGVVLSLSPQQSAHAITGLTPTRFTSGAVTYYRYSGQSESNLRQGIAAAAGFGAVSQPATSATQPAVRDPSTGSGQDASPQAPQPAGGATGAVIPDKVDVPGLVKEVRASEAWIDSVKSFYLRLQSQWTKTPDGVALRRAELQKQFPEASINEETFTELRPHQADTVELAFDSTRAAKIERLEGAHDSRLAWDGRQLLVCWKDLHAKHTSYRLDKKCDDDLTLAMFSALSWARAGKHVFWWYSDQAKREDLQAAPEDFVLVGKERFRGVECYVLMAPMPNSGNDWRWYVSVADHRLRGLAWGWARDQKKSTQLLAEIALREGKRSRDADELWKWVEALPAAKKTAVEREYRQKSFALFQPSSLFWLDDYREVTPGCWLPMQQGYCSFEVASDGHVFETMRREMTITEVRVNRVLDSALFEVAATEEDASVLDLREDVPLSYKVKKDRTPEEWAKIRADATTRAAEREKGRRFRDDLIGKPAPAFSQGAQWLNGGGLTWNDLAGKIVLVDFWADWCAPCRNDLPLLAGLHKSQQNAGIVVVGVHASGSRLEDIQKVMNTYDMKYPVVVDVRGDKQAWGKLFEQYGIEAIPYAFLIDGQGRIAAHGQVSDLVVKASKLAEASASSPATRPATQPGRLDETTREKVDQLKKAIGSFDLTLFACIDSIQGSGRMSNRVRVSDIVWQLRVGPGQALATQPARKIEVTREEASAAIELLAPQGLLANKETFVPAVGQTYLRLELNGKALIQGATDDPVLAAFLNALPSLLAPDSAKKMAESAKALSSAAPGAATQPAVRAPSTGSGQDASPQATQPGEVQPAKKHSVEIHLVTRSAQETRDIRITQEGIRQYDWETHTVHLRPGGAGRLFDPQVFGGTFEVIVDGQTLYRGSLTTMMSSVVPECPVIQAGPTAGQFQPKDAIRIYPPPGGTPDPRNDNVLKQALQDLGLLKDSPIPVPATQPAVRAPSTGPGQDASPQATQPAQRGGFGEATSPEAVARRVTGTDTEAELKERAAREKQAFEEAIRKAMAPGPGPSTAPAQTTTQPAGPPEAEADALIRKRLAQVLPKLEFTGIAFSDVVQFLRDVSNCTINVNWTALEAAGTGMDAPVNVKLANVTVEKALRTILDDVGRGNPKPLDFTVLEGAILISTKESLDRMMTVVRVYDVRDLIASLPEPQPGPIGWQGQPPASAPAPSTGSGPGTQPVTRQELLDNLLKLIQETIAPDTWIPQAQIGSIRELSGQLVVTQTPVNHQALLALLQQLRQARSLQILTEWWVVDAGAEGDGALREWLAEKHKVRLDNDARATVLTGDVRKALLEQAGGLKGVQLLAAPRVTTYNGQPACVTIGERVRAGLARLDEPGKTAAIEFAGGSSLSLVGTVSADRRSVLFSLAVETAELTPDREGNYRTTRSKAAATAAVPVDRVLLLRLPMPQTAFAAQGVRRETDPASGKAFDKVVETPLPEKSERIRYVLIQPSVIVQPEHEEVRPPTHQPGG